MNEGFAPTCPGECGDPVTECVCYWKGYNKFQDDHGEELIAEGARLERERIMLDLAFLRDLHDRGSEGHLALSYAMSRVRRGKNNAIERGEHE